MPADVLADLVGLGLVDGAGPTAKGRRLASVSAGALLAYDALQGARASAEAAEGVAAPKALTVRRKAVAPAGGASRVAVVRDFDSWTDARRAAFDRAGLDCRTPLGEFMARTVSAHIPAKWANCRIFGGIAHGPRDLRVPRAQYWPGGEYPKGMVVVDGAVETAPIERAVMPKASRKLFHSIPKVHILKAA